MIIKNVNLDRVCGITSLLPDNDVFEIAFAGKSNVGKSSLINALINRKAYARTSAQPGKTQTINFYRVERKTEDETAPAQFYYVDLPGYGYAKVSAEERKKWGPMIEKYLNTSKKLLAVFLLLDIRHEPSANDTMMFDWICKNGFRPVIVCTKQDKLTKNQTIKQISVIKRSLGLGEDDRIIAFSAQSKTGLGELDGCICEILNRGER